MLKNTLLLFQWMRNFEYQQRSTQRVWIWCFFATEMCHSSFCIIKEFGKGVLIEAFDKDAAKWESHRFMLTAAVSAGFSTIYAGYDVLSIQIVGHQIQIIQVFGYSEFDVIRFACQFGSRNWTSRYGWWRR